MKHSSRYAFLLALIVGCGVSALGQGSAPATASSTPSSGTRAEIIDQLKYFEQRFTKLAEAVPAEKFTWRPAEGVRSIAEVYLHASFANYNLPLRLFGAPLPSGLDLNGLEKSTTDKARIIQTLHESFAHIRGAIANLSDADVEKKLKLFGQDSTYRGGMILIIRHLGEHLGQSIAYARINGVVPPWTEDFQRQQKALEKPKQ